MNFILPIFTTIWCASIIFAPILRYFHLNEYSFFIYAFFSRICHQIPERSFYIFGNPLPVCERCTGIYFGFIIGVYLFPMISKKIKYEKPSREMISIALIILLTDFIFGYIGILQNEFTRILSGVIFGIISSYFIAYGINDIIASQKSKEKPVGNTI